MVRELRWKVQLTSKYKYYIFDDGRIWSSYKKDFKKTFINKDGYLCTSFNTSKGKRIICIHKLVEYNFMDMSLKKNFKDPTVDHIDSDKLNNHVTNLRYLERGDNTRRGKHYVNTYHHSKLTPDDVALIKMFLRWGRTVQEIINLNVFDISSATICQIKNNKAWVWV